MKKIFFSIIALCIVVISTANNNETKSETQNETSSEVMSGSELNGCIIDSKSLETLVGVEVRIEGTNLKTYTDFDGHFSFGNLKPDKYKIVASYISYEKNTIEVNELRFNNNISIKMESSN